MSGDIGAGANAGERFFRESEISKWDRETGVLVLGLGCAGACAALEADAAGAEVTVWMGSAVEEPLAIWFSLDQATRECWRDYFNNNERERPLSPCLRRP